MTSKRTKPNFSMYLPDDVREQIDKQIAAGRNSSVAAFLIEAARMHLSCIKFPES